MRRPAMLGAIGSNWAAGNHQPLLSRLQCDDVLTYSNLNPMLLVRTGTFPMQSERFYAALKGHGAPCRLVILPHESHGYR